MGADTYRLEEYVNKAVFLDRDGTLIRNYPYAHDPERIELLDGVVDGLRLLQGAGYCLVVITNQSGIARGYFTETELAHMHERLAQLLGRVGVHITRFYHCPHHAEGVVPEYSFVCSCRKPAPGMLLQAAEELEIDLSRSWLIGDILDDVEAGNRVGCRTVLLDLGTETLPAPPRRAPTFVAAEFLGAAQLILSDAAAPTQQATTCEADLRSRAGGLAPTEG